MKKHEKPTTPKAEALGEMYSHLGARYRRMTGKATRGSLVPGEQRYCPVPAGWAPPPVRLAEDARTETPRMRSAAIRNVGNTSGYPGDKSLASGKREYELGKRNQTRSSS